MDLHRRLNPLPGREDLTALQAPLPPTQGTGPPEAGVASAGTPALRRERRPGLLLCNFAAGTLIVLAVGLVTPLLSASSGLEGCGKPGTGACPTLLERLKRQYPLKRKLVREARTAAGRAEARGRLRLAALYRLLLEAGEAGGGRGD